LLFELNEDTTFFIFEGDFLIELNGSWTVFLISEAVFGMLVIALLTQLPVTGINIAVTNTSGKKTKKKKESNTRVLNL